MSFAAACFALIGGSGGGLTGVWGEVAPFIALNGLLYIVVSILSLLRASSGSVDMEAELIAPPALKQKTEVLTEVAPVSSRSEREISPDKSGGREPSKPANTMGTESSSASMNEPEFQRGGFRPTIPKAIPINVQLSPEEELAEQMKPVGPTPPPIRFEWKN